MGPDLEELLNIVESSFARVWKDYKRSIFNDHARDIETHMIRFSQDEDPVLFYLEEIENKDSFMNALAEIRLLIVPIREEE